MENNLKYSHEESIHNLKDPRIIVPFICDILRPKSVVDLGCGIGTFLHVFQENGVAEILGLDGNWVDKDKLSKNIKLSDFKEVDIERGFVLNEKFDLAICLEVLEHVDEKYSENAVKILTELSDVIIFSAAIPGQGGQNHVNEQWFEYWQLKFSKFGYKFYDVFRPIFWNNSELAVWYKQNMFLVTKSEMETELSQFQKFFDIKIKNYIHPEYFNQAVVDVESYANYYHENQNQLKMIKNGERSIKFYLKLLLKSLIMKVGL
jgi:SAM-dependent methyltransferase